MTESLKEAVLAAELGEDPVVAVVVVNRRVVGKAHHQTKSLRDPTAHAEMIALTQAAEVAGQSPGKGITLVATEMPCPMCLEAAKLNGVRRIIYGSKRKQAVSSKIALSGPVLPKECAALRRNQKVFRC